MHQEVLPIHLDVEKAYRRIRLHINHTPLEYNRELSRLIRGEVYLKLESEQKTGSFKIRGALNRILSLACTERRQGVVTASAGNHALGVAHGASLMRIPAIIYLPRTASRAKIQRLREYPANLRLVEGNYDDAEAAALLNSRHPGRVYISPYNDPWVISGGGTVAYEILKDNSHFDAIIVPVGGGGLISGISTWIKAKSPKAKVYGAQSFASPTMHHSLKAGRIVRVPIRPSLADGLAGNLESTTATFPICKKNLEEILLVSEREIRQAMLWALFEIHKVIEGSAAVAIAALRRHQKKFRGKKVVLMITGSNFDIGITSLP